MSKISIVKGEDRKENIRYQNIKDTKEKIHIRPNWDEMFMAHAFLAATRSSCIHLNTGCVIVKDHRILSSGYNGAPPGIENCLERGCRKEKFGIEFNKKGTGTCRGAHAEINTLSRIARAYKLKISKPILQSTFPAFAYAHFRTYWRNTNQTLLFY